MGAIRNYLETACLVQGIIQAPSLPPFEESSWHEGRRCTQNSPLLGPHQQTPKPNVCIVKESMFVPMSHHVLNLSSSLQASVSFAHVGRVETPTPLGGCNSICPSKPKPLDVQPHLVALRSLTHSLAVFVKPHQRGRPVLQLSRFRKADGLLLV